MKLVEFLASQCLPLRWLWIIVFLIQTVPTYAQTLIPVPTRRDHVFDNTRNILYITTSSISGDVQRYDLGSHSLLSPFAGPNTSLYGIDTTPDDQFIYIASGGTHGFYKYNADTGARTDLLYSPAFFEGHAWDVAVTDAGHAIVTTEFNGSGWIPMRRLDLATDTFSSEIRSVRQRTHLHRSADRSTVFYLESNISSGPIGLYDPDTRIFSNELDTGSTNSNKLGAVNRN